jgi:hypothetical protein
MTHADRQALLTELDRLSLVAGRETGAHPEDAAERLMYQAVDVHFARLDKQIAAEKIAMDALLERLTTRPA